MRVYFGRSLSFFTPRHKFSLEIIFFSIMSFFLILGRLKSKIYGNYVKLLLGKKLIWCASEKKFVRYIMIFFSLQATLVPRCLLHIDQKKKKKKYLRYLRLNLTSFNQEYTVEIVLWLKYVPTYLVTLQFTYKTLNVIWSFDAKNRNAQQTFHWISFLQSHFLGGFFCKEMNPYVYRY